MKHKQDDSVDCKDVSTVVKVILTVFLDCYQH